MSPLNEEGVTIGDAKWHIRFMDLAVLVATWSKDPSTQVGAVVVDDMRRVLNVGFNGFPRGVKDHSTRYNERDTKYQFVVHAELNAILNVPAPHLLRGASIYSTLFPCNECAKAIIQVGIKSVLAPVKENDRWAVSHGIAVQMFEEAGVTVVPL